ncbi:hypothetical protein BGZ82_009243 [Podila clonocystis]|nr:hypothetical protein BGZ82_009243 [Podila clonocystis]
MYDFDVRHHSNAYYRRHDSPNCDTHIHIRVSAAYLYTNRAVIHLRTAIITAIHINSHVATHFRTATHITTATHVRSHVDTHVTAHSNPNKLTARTAANDHSNAQSYPIRSVTSCPNNSDQLASPDDVAYYSFPSHPYHANSPGGGPGTGPGSGYDDNSGSNPGHGLSRQSKLVIIIIGGTLGCLALICVVSFLVHRWRQKRLRRIGRGGVTAPFLANDGFMKLSAAMSGGNDGGGKRESDRTVNKARAGKRESRGPNFIHEELGEERYRSWHDPQGRASNDSKRSIDKAMMNSRRTSLASSRRSSFQNLRRTPGPQGSSPSMVGEDFSYYGVGFYTPDMLNGPHKVIGGSQASSLSGGRESRTFLRDSEYYHDDRRSWNTNSSRVSLGGSSTASDAYLLPRDMYSYDEEGGERREQIPLEEQVAFIKAQQQDMDRQRYEQQQWLDRMEGAFESGSGIDHI